jgi:hypothetical protein
VFENRIQRKREAKMKAKAHRRHSRFGRPQGLLGDGQYRAF